MYLLDISATGTYDIVDRVEALSAETIKGGKWWRISKNEAKVLSGMSISARCAWVIHHTGDKEERESRAQEALSKLPREIISSSTGDLARANSQEESEAAG